MKLRMERNGQFTVNWKTSAATQCGVPGNNILSYRVVFETSDKHLDPNGFIIDNHQVHEYFVSKYSNVDKFVSCELIATAACRDFRQLMPNLFGGSISISGNPAAAWLTAHWSRNDEPQASTPIAVPKKAIGVKPTSKKLPASPSLF